MSGTLFALPLSLSLSGITCSGVISALTCEYLGGPVMRSIQQGKRALAKNRVSELGSAPLAFRFLQPHKRLWARTTQLSPLSIPDPQYLQKAVKCC